MSDQLGQNGKKSKITTELRTYIEKRVQLLTLTITEKVSQIAAESFQQILGLFILSFALFFLWFAVGFFLAEIIGSMSAGFALASIPLFILGFILINTKSNRITDKIQAKMISRVLEDLDMDEEVKQIEGEKVEQK